MEKEKFKTIKNFYQIRLSRQKKEKGVSFQLKYIRERSLIYRLYENTQRQIEEPAKHL